MSKGSKQRPRQVDYDIYCRNWDSIFGQEIQPTTYVPPNYDEWEAQWESNYRAGYHLDPAEE